MLWRQFFTIFTLICAAAGNAQAQSRIRIEGPEGLYLVVGPFNAEATIDQVATALEGALANYDNTSIHVRDGVINPGEVFATRAIPYERARRLQTDVTRGTLTGRAVIMRAGTPLYSDAFANEDLLWLNGSTRGRTLWCGANGAAGYCLLQRRGEWEGAEIRSSTPYAPQSLGPFIPVSDADIAADPTAALELPERSEAYRFVGLDGARPTIIRTLRAGAASFDHETLRENRIRLGSILLRFTPGPDGAMSVEHAPMNPADYRTELRQLARNIVAEIR
jgi:hypothetical protein